MLDKSHNQDITFREYCRSGNLNGTQTIEYWEYGGIRTRRIHGGWPPHSDSRTHVHARITLEYRRYQQRSGDRQKNQLITENGAIVCDGGHATDGDLITLGRVAKEKLTKQRGNSH
jgi:hypothetical protein